MRSNHIQSDASQSCNQLQLITIYSLLFITSHVVFQFSFFYYYSIKRNFNKSTFPKQNF